MDEMCKGFGSFSARRNLPDCGPMLYAVDGISIFPVYGEGGGLTMEQRSFIVDVKDGEVRSFGFDPFEMTVEKAMEAFRDRFLQE